MITDLNKEKLRIGGEVGDRYMGWSSEDQRGREREKGGSGPRRARWYGGKT